MSILGNMNDMLGRKKALTPQDEEERDELGCDDRQDGFQCQPSGRK
jgi:hypothetical protein